MFRLETGIYCMTAQSNKPAAERAIFATRALSMISPAKQKSSLMSVKTLERNALFRRPAANHINDAIRRYAGTQPPV